MANKTKKAEREDGEGVSSFLSSTSELERIQRVQEALKYRHPEDKNKAGKDLVSLAKEVYSKVDGNSGPITDEKLRERNEATGKSNLDTIIATYTQQMDEQSTSFYRKHAEQIADSISPSELENIALSVNPKEPNALSARLLQDDNFTKGYNIFAQYKTLESAVKDYEKNGKLPKELEGVEQEGVNSGIDDYYKKLLASKKEEAKKLGITYSDDHYEMLRVIAPLGFSRLSEDDKKKYVSKGLESLRDKFKKDYESSKEKMYGSVRKAIKELAKEKDKAFDTGLSYAYSALKKSASEKSED